MGRARRCLVCVVVGLGFSAPASVEASHNIPSVLTQYDFKLNATNGYRLNVTAYGRGERRVQVFAELKREGGSAAYIVKGESSSGGLRANFGRFGRIAMKFKPDSGDEADGCNSKARGTFVGTLRFRGENGFAEARASRVRGQRRVRTFGPCEDRAAERLEGRAALSPRRSLIIAVGADFPSKKLRNATVLAACGPDPSVSYFGARAGRHVTHSASIYERGARVSVLRSAQSGGPRSTFRASKDLSTATITPSGRFSGKGRYTTLGFLSGDLTATFPGLDAPVELTPGEATLSKGFGGGFPRCEESLAAPPEVP